MSDSAEYDPLVKALEKTRHNVTIRLIHRKHRNGSSNTFLKHTRPLHMNEMLMTLMMVFEDKTESASTIMQTLRILHFR